MKTNNSDGPVAAESDIRIRKFGEARDLLIATFDLLNDEITGPIWLATLAKLANCASVNCIWWRAGQPDSYLEEASNQKLHPTLRWMRQLDKLVTAVAPRDAGLLDELAVKAALAPYESENTIFTPDKLIACLDWEPSRVLIVFSDRNDSPDWDAFDREQFNNLLPTIRKSIVIKKQLSKLKDIEEQASKISDEDRRGVITFILGGEVTATNRLARQILDDAATIRINGTTLEFCDPELQHEFAARISLLREIDRDKLDEFVWYKKLGNQGQSGALLLSMRAFDLEEWRRESSPSNRTVVITLEQLQDHLAPKEQQLREFYQLTAAQARFTRALMEKANVEAAAAECNISINTARSHLRSIYQRVGVDNMPKLMQRLSSH